MEELSVLLYFDYIYSGLRNYFICREKCKTWKLTNKSENIFNFVTWSAWTPMSVSMRKLQTMVLAAFHPGFQIKVPQYTATHYILITTETTEQHGNLNLFHFQHDRMWPVNMTGKTKGWPVNSPISPDIVRWPAVISSPALGYLRILHLKMAMDLFSVTAKILQLLIDKTSNLLLVSGDNFNIYTLTMSHNCFIEYSWAPENQFPG